MWHRITIIILIAVCVLVTLSLWLWCRDPQALVKWWNQRIRSECDAQDIEPLNGIPSYYNAQMSHNNLATELHYLIQLNHDDILAEVTAALPVYNGITLGNLSHWSRDDDKWHPIWIKFMGTWAGYADRIPTLKRIVALFPGVPTVYISIFEPGATLVAERGLSRAVQRYHYGLRVAPNDIGLNIAGYDVAWHEKEGAVWDDTLPHSAWNHTSTSRIVIFADVIRNLSPLSKMGSEFVYYRLKHTPHVSVIHERLQHEGLVLS